MEYIIIISSFIIAYGYWGLRKMCFKCFRWNGLKILRNEHSHYETRYRTKEHRTTIRDKHQNIIGYKDEPVQESYTVNYNQVTFGCSKCHQQIQRTLRPFQYIIETVVVFIICYAILFNEIHPKKQKSKSNNNTEINSTNESNQSTSDQSSAKNNLNKKSKQQNQIISVDKDNSSNQSSMNNDTSTNSKIDKNSIVDETNIPNDLNIKHAIGMLKRDKSVRDIMDSTNLSRKEIRQLRRQLKNE